MSDYELAPYGSNADHLLGRCLEFQQEGDAWLQAQAPARDFQAAMTLLSGPHGADHVVGLSNLHYPKTARIGRELVAALSGFRHEGEFEVRHDKTLYDTAHMLTNLDRNWYTSTNANEKHRAGIQYGVGLGTGYWLETWDKHYWGPFQGDISLEALGPQDVTFVQLPRDHNIQRAYAVIIRKELPINLARAMYGGSNPSFAANLVPDRDSPGWLQKGLQKVQQFLSPALRVAGRTDPKNTGSFPTVDIFEMYTMDLSVNEGPLPIRMGVEGTNWSYMVPTLGSPIPTGIRNPATGAEWTIPATADHCRMFPLRRYTIFSRTGVCYDGSSPWWHGEAPVARIRFQDYAWEALGKSLLTPMKSIEDGLILVMRAVEDSINARLDPPALVDDSMGQAWGKAFNIRMGGARALAPLQSIQNPITFPVDPGIYNVPDFVTTWIDAQERRMNYLAGVEDLTAIMKARQLPSADAMEKLLEMAGPIVQDLIRAEEEPLRQLGQWRLSLYMQFYTKPRMLTTVGDDGVPVKVEYLPEKLLPYIDGESPEQRFQRARKLISEFQYKITQSGVSEVNRMSQLLTYIQLSKTGVLPISWWTFADMAKVPNYGPPPLGTNTEMERVIAQQQIQADQQIELAQKMAAGAPPPMGGEPGLGPSASEQNAGRPPSFNKPPRLVSKDGGARSTIETS